jgi:transcriptional regulator GlxA family with amidase domain
VTGAPRRTLELEFRRSMGCTPYQFIARARVTRAQELLSAPTPTKLTAIAAACGFADLRRFRLVFRREAGISPAEFRAAQSRPLRQP